MNSSEAIQRALSEIKQKDDLIKAFVSVDHGARAQTSGPLRGITFGVKDIIEHGGSTHGDGVVDLRRLASEG